VSGVGPTVGRHLQCLCTDSPFLARARQDSSGAEVQGTPGDGARKLHLLRPYQCPLQLFPASCRTQPTALRPLSAATRGS